MAKNRKMASSKAPKAEKRPVAVEVEVVEEKKGMGWEGGVAIVTTILLLIAVLCVDWDLGHKYGEGMFFK